MIKNLVSVFFTVLFMAITTVPSIISVMDDSMDVSIFYDLSEEEEEKENEKTKVLEFFFEANKEPISFMEYNGTECLGFNYKKYPKPHLNLISPPPEV